MRWLVTLAVVSACYSPQPAPGAACPDGVCPSGLVCSPATRTCELTASDAGTDGRTGDAARDAAADAPAPMVTLRGQATSYIDQAASISATLPSSPAAGSVLVMIGATPSGALTSVTGGGIITWTLATKSTVNANIEVWYGTTTGSSPTVTITRTSSAAPIWIHISEWSGLTGALDGAKSFDGNAGPANPGSLTTTTTDLLLFGVANFPPNTSGTPTPGNWTALTAINGMYATQHAWYSVAPAGTYSPNVSQTGNGWDAALVALKAN